MTRTATHPGILQGGLLGGADPEALAARFGTPYYAYDLDLVTAQVEALRAVLPASVDLAYAVKANPLLAVLRHLAGLGVGVDVASGGELRHVLRAGFGAGRVVFTGPGKRDVELEAAVDAGVRVVTVESRGELRRLDAVAGALGRVQPVLLRLSVPDAGRREPVRIIGDDGAGKFGMDLDDLVAAAGDAVASPHLEPLGIHAFGASNLLDAGTLAAHVEATVETAAAVARRVGFPLRLVDAGGGLGIPYGHGEPGLDLTALGERLAAIASRMATDPTMAVTRVVLEPGRFLVGASGAYVARVTDTKTVDGSRVAILDGGMHHVLRPALVGREHRVVALTGAAAGRIPDGPSVTVAGPLCTGLDILARSAPLAGLAVGDLVAVLDVGAYGATEAMPLFLSHPMPAEVVLRGGEPALARPRIEPETWLDWHIDVDGV
ncbi:MAG TPA: alanine racemase [Candidatus Limnocylindrales bacterium]|jgi:diaminopimelate decarboxylase